jgi:hypothetical protein
MQSRRKRSAQTGFTLIEAVISIVILTVGILSLAAIFAQGILLASLTQYNYIAEKKAEEAVETIFAARNDRTLVWSQLQNTTGGAPLPGIFMVGPRPLCNAGPDGFVGTADDDCTNPDQVITAPGVTVPLSFMQRQIDITQVLDAGGNPEPNIRLITVTITYKVASTQRTYTLVSYISSFS